MNDIQRAFVTSWEDCIETDILKYATELGYTLDSSTLYKLVEDGLEIVNEISWSIPEKLSFKELRNYNKKCSDRILNIVAGIPCTC